MCVQDVEVESSMVGDGCLIQPGCKISNSVVGLRSKIYANSIIEDSLLMGSDYYERPEDCELAAHCLPMGIGANSCASPPFIVTFVSLSCALYAQHCLGLCGRLPSDPLLCCPVSSQCTLCSVSVR